MTSPIYWIECKTGESNIVIRRLLADKEHAMLLSFNEFCTRHEGDHSRIINEIMSALKSDCKQDLILWNSHLWLDISSSSRMSNGNVEDSEGSDSEGDGAVRVKSYSVDLMFSILCWFRVISARHDVRLYLVSDFAAPRKLKMLNINVVSDFPISKEHSDSPTRHAILLGEDISTRRCVCLRGGSGSGKSSALYGLACSLNNEAVWLRTHEIINCELGETGRIVRESFLRASGYRPSVVLMDDADLCLNTSGKIVKECVEEISNCLSEMEKVVFVFAIASDVDAAIMSKVDRVIHIS
jgi:hypothetical protein